MGKMHNNQIPEMFLLFLERFQQDIRTPFAMLHQTNYIF